MTEVDTVLYVSRPESQHARFDETTHTWTVDDRCARVIIASDGALPTYMSRLEGLEPYLGVAVHGVPNCFLLTGPDSAAQKSYIAKCLAYLSRTGSTRVEVRSRTQRHFNDRSSRRKHRSGHYWRRVGRKIPSAFTVSSLADAPDVDEAVYDGPATVRIADQSHRTRVRLTGRLDPIDGHYHWRGTLFDSSFDVKPPQQVIVAIGERTAPARLTERPSRSTYAVAGVGAPPFELEGVEIEVPLL